MSFFDRFNGMTVNLLGAGVSNKPLVKKLADGGAKVIIRDKKTVAELGAVADEFASAGAQFVCGEDYLSDISGDLVFRSPGFRPDIAPLCAAVENGCQLTSEMEMFIENCPCPIIGLTGSDGKSTTTTLVANILRESGHNCFLGGNIGEPLLNRIDNIKKDDIIAVELSSFQLMTIDSPVTVAVIKNITPNHLNWHTDMDEYIEAKAKILKGAETAVLNYDDENCRKLSERFDGEILWFSRRELPASLNGAFLREGELIMRYEGKETFVIKTDEILLPGEHNAENYATAVCATWGKTTVEAVRKVAREFGGVKHRFQVVRRDGGITYYNSSIDSSPTRTAAAISSLKCPVNIICGGYDKNIPFEPLAQALVAHGKIKTVVLTGATMGKIKKALEDHPNFESSGIKVICAPDFKDAVIAAAGEAEPGEAVLLSPACASFDAFENFEKRGEFFAETVKGL
ncbi:MAG: UDP-N-acetylmuramoyl-L-alanine--D-glutamate ligase [Clostridia bacterium]|nr:UDP-N-acetylmuramoyl-L-alanine--D-glutamate ligase [Clostridia bacterium]